MDAILQVFENSTDAVFGVNKDGRVLFANRALEKLLGLTREQMCGRQCADLLCGTDMHGQAFCGPHCPIPKSISRHTSVRDFDLMVTHASGDSLLVNIGACYTPPQLLEQAGQVNAFFSLRRINPLRLLQRMSTRPSEGSKQKDLRRQSRLTSRETEILELATRGMKTNQIAERLCVSSQTVRSHFKNIYTKIGVHSRTEAVVFALKQGLN
jgi:DNA-binding CsgD family transcriptional regulator